MMRGVTNILRGVTFHLSLTMPTNVEVKASITDLEQFLRNAKQLSGSEGKVLSEGTIFNAF